MSREESFVRLLIDKQDQEVGGGYRPRCELYRVALEGCVDNVHFTKILDPSTHRVRLFLTKKREAFASPVFIINP